MQWKKSLVVSAMMLALSSPGFAQQTSYPFPAMGTSTTGTGTSTYYAPGATTGTYPGMTYPSTPYSYPGTTYPNPYDPTGMGTTPMPNNPLFPNAATLQGNATYVAPSASGMTTMTVPGLNLQYQPAVGDYFDQIQPKAPRWAGFPLYVYVYAPQTSQELNSQHYQQAMMAIQEWQPYLPLQVVMNPQQAQIELVWVNGVEGGRAGQVKVVQSHQDPATGVPILDKVRIEVVQGDRYRSLATNTLKAVIMQEMGRSFGLWGQSPNKYDVMGAQDYLKGRGNQVVKQVVKSLALKAIQTTLDIPTFNLAPAVNPATPIPASDKVSQRDLNTLYRIYNSPM